MRAWMVTKDNGIARSELTETVTDDQLGEGDVVVRVEYSSVNFKDGLALTGRPGVIRHYPLIAGIDLVGTVVSGSDQFAPGDRVLVNGWGIGESHHGGLAERARVRSEWLVSVPPALSPKRAAALGTAGFTAMLSVLALERANALHGDVLVTGAGGGVGSIAVTLLAALGHRVIASTGRPELHGYLRDLGASDFVERADLAEPGKALQGERWSGVIDTVGSHTLANALAQTSYGGTVAACGLAGGADLPATVMPFILRGVTLVGINSVFAAPLSRIAAWDRLAVLFGEGSHGGELLDRLTTTIGMTQVGGAAEEIVAGRLRGRTVVDVRA